MNDFPKRGYPVNESGERRYAVKEPPERRYPVNDFPDGDYASTGMRSARRGYEIRVESRNETLEFKDADDCLINGEGLLTMWRDGEMLAMFAPGRWDYVIDRKACFGDGGWTPMNEASTMPDLRSFGVDDTAPEFVPRERDR